MRTLLTNCLVTSPECQLCGASLVIENGVIDSILPSGAPTPTADDTRDLAGQRVVPGFIDIHCHGRGGADFCDGHREAFDSIGQGKLSEGVTGFLATTMTVSEQCLEQTFEAAADYMAHPTGAKLLGMHLEGPFITPSCAGAQNPDFLRLPDIALVDRLDAICPIRKVSFSPELSGGVSFTRQLVERGIMPSGAHSTADYELFLEARGAGMRHLTHFCNVMTPLHHLQFGMVGGGLRFPDILVEVIADGVHLCDEMIDLIFHTKTCDGVMLITDAMRGAAMPDGKYDLGGLPVQVAGGTAQLRNGKVAGSTLQLDAGLRRVQRVTGLPLKDLLKTTGRNQSRSLGLGDVGDIRVGAPADLVVLSDELEPMQVWVEGELRYGDIP